MWKSLYDPLLELFTLKWSTFIAQSVDSDLAQQLRNTFRNDIYAKAGSVLVIVTGLTCFFYYYVLAKRPGYYFKLKYWFTCLLAAAVIVFTLTYFLSASEVKMFSAVKPLKFTFNLAVINTLYSAILFWIISIFIKWWSPAKTTPRFYPH